MFQFIENSVVSTERGKRKFTHDGFIYIRNKASKKDPSLIFWRCENECKVRISLK